MLRLKRTNEVPPGFFTFVVPETGYKVQEVTLERLIKLIKLHYETNGIPLPENYSEIIEDRICQKLDGRWCTETEPGSRRFPPCRMRAEQIMQGTTSIIKILKNKLTGNDEDNFVSQEEADQRSLICSRCPFNYIMGGCLSCGTMGKIIEKVSTIKGARKTKHDDKLENCCVCGCRTETIVHVKLDILNACIKEKDMLKYPKWCWKRTNNFEESESELCLSSTKMRT